MSIKTKEALLQELAAAVRSGGQGGKTTATDVRTFLVSLTAELYERTAAGTEAAQPFLFQVNALDDAGHYHLAALTVEQVRRLVQQDVTTVTVLSEARSGHQHEITFGYDHQQATFTVQRVVRAGTDVLLPSDQETTASHEVLLIGRAGSGEASSTLEFVFEAGFTDEVRRTMGPNQAATYHGQQLQNVDGVRYRLNGEDTELPFTVAATDMLEVLIFRPLATRAAVVTLTS